MTVIRVLLAIAPLVLSACATSSRSTSEIRTFNADLRQAFEDRAATMSEQREPLALPSGATVSTCREYLQHADTIKRDDPDQMRALQEYVICDSMALLDRAQPSPATSIDAGQSLATRLDFRTFPSSRGPRTSDQAFTFEALAKGQLLVETNAATLDSEEWYLRVERVAAADFDGNGREDWLVWIGDDSNVGTYQTFHALLVYNVTETGVLTGEPIP